MSSKVSRFITWFFDLDMSKDVENRDAVDRAVYVAFSGPSGKLVLDYLIAAHYAIVTVPDHLMQSQYNEGRRAVVQDLLDAYDRHMRAAPEVKTES